MNKYPSPRLLLMEETHFCMEHLSCLCLDFSEAQADFSGVWGRGPKALPGCRVASKGFRAGKEMWREAADSASPWDQSLAAGVGPGQTRMTLTRAMMMSRSHLLSTYYVPGTVVGLYTCYLINTHNRASGYRCCPQFNLIFFFFKIYSFIFGCAGS